MVLKIILLIILGEIAICSAQFLFKKGANKLQLHGLNTFVEYLSFVRSSLLIPEIWGGIFMNGLAIVVWVLLLALLDLSFAVPLDSLHYIFILTGSYFFLKERITWEKVIATICIVIGIFLVAAS